MAWIYGNELHYKGEVGFLTLEKQEQHPYRATYEMLDGPLDTSLWGGDRELMHGVAGWYNNVRHEALGVCEVTCVIGHPGNDDYAVRVRVLRGREQRKALEQLGFSYDVSRGLVRIK